MDQTRGNSSISNKANETEYQEHNTLLQKVAFAALLMFVFTVPWESLIDVGQLGSLARLTGLIAVPLGVLVVLEKRRTHSIPPFLIASATWLVFTIASYFWSIQPRYTLQAITTYLQLVLMVWLIIEQARTPEHFQALLLAAILGCYLAIGTFAVTAGPSAVRLAVTGSASSFQRRMLDTWVGSGAPRFTSGLALFVPAARYLSLRLKNGFWRTISFYYPLILVPVLFIAASRGGLAAYLVAVLIYFFTAPIKDRGRLVRWTLSIIVSVIFGLWVVSNFVPTWSIERLARFGDEVSSGNFSNRGQRWEATIKIFEEHPILGIGPNTFGVVTDFTNSGSNTDTAHNVFFALLGETGIAGVALYGAMLLSVFLPLRKLKGYERWLGLITLATWGTIAFSLSWQYRKATWLAFAIVAVLPYIAAEVQAREERAQSELQLPIKL